MRIRGGDGHDWQSVLTVTRRWEADLAKSYLQANGLDVTIVSDDLGGQRPDVALVWGVHVMVRVDDLGAARDLLDEAERAAAEDERA